MADGQMSDRTRIILAVIGLISALGVAVIANLDLSTSKDEKVDSIEPTEQVLSIEESNPIEDQVEKTKPKQVQRLSKTEFETLPEDGKWKHSDLEIHAQDIDPEEKNANIVISKNGAKCVCKARGFDEEKPYRCPDVINEFDLSAIGLEVIATRTFRDSRGKKIELQITYLAN